MTAPNFASETIWTGDNLPVLRGMNSACVDLIYLDPPFSKNKTYAAPIGSKAAGAWFKDTWTLDDVDVHEHGELAERHPPAYAVIEAARQAYGKGMMAYLISMAVRVMEMHRVLKPTGTIWLHCDQTAGHYLKALLDCIFGQRNFIAEVAWYIGARSGAIAKHKPGKAHETLLAYAFDYGKHTYNLQYLPYSERYLKWFRHTDKDGRKYRTRTRRGKLLRQYLDESPGVPLHDTWTDIPHLYTSQGWFPHNRDEITGYPTQKPLALLERIIKASSNEGDLVLDPFCGCATTLVAADRLQRQWAGIDLSPLAIKLVDDRIAADRTDKKGGEVAGGGLFRATALTEPPLRTDLGDLPNYRTHRHRLYGEQEGVCAGCATHFPFRVMEVDHILPRSRGGTDHPANLQLLCSGCNRSKGGRTMAEWRAAGP